MPCVLCLQEPSEARAPRIQLPQHTWPRADRVCVRERWGFPTTWVNTAHVACQSQFCCLPILLQTDDWPASEFVIGGGRRVSDRAGRKGCFHGSPFLFQWMLYVVMKFTHWCTISNRSWNQQQVRHGMEWFFFPRTFACPRTKKIVSGSAWQ